MKYIHFSRQFLCASHLYLTTLFAAYVEMQIFSNDMSLITNVWRTAFTCQACPSNIHETRYRCDILVWFSFYKHLTRKICSLFISASLDSLRTQKK